MTKIIKLKGEKTMKTAEELNALKEEFKVLSAKLAELTEEELSAVTGGNGKESNDPDQGCSWGSTWIHD